MISLFQHKFRFLDFQMYTILLKYAELFLYLLNNPDFGKRIENHNTIFLFIRTQYFERFLAEVVQISLSL
jgi:hypothetical protein